MKNTTKIVQPIRVLIGKRTAAVFCKITLTDGKLSITGVEGPTASGNARGGCGQIDMGYEHSTAKNNDPRYHRYRKTPASYGPGWDRAKWQRFLDVWHDWHLNDMRSGCVHQRALGWTYQDHHDPKTFKGEPCPECGYEIGSSWLKEALPEDVIEFLNSLPETTEKPAWV